MAEAYNGKVLFVDLTSGSIKEESLPGKIYRDFIGGTGLGVRILYERMKPKADPLGPDNMLGFVTGLLLGSGTPIGMRLQLVGKSPVTGGWGDSNVGGHFSLELKSAGYDAVFFSGISPKPVYLFIHDGKAEIKDATHLWGKDTSETMGMICQELGDKKIKVACIGPAGEAKSLLAAVIHDIGAAGRSGLGAVMGSKRLKAFAVRGTIKFPIADKQRFDDLRRDCRKEYKETEHGWNVMLRTWGTNSFTSPCITAGETPIKNWTLFGEEGFPNHGKLNGDEVIKYQARKVACTSCPVACHGVLKQEKGRYGISGEVAKPEYETLAMLGTNCLNDDVESVIKANHLCNLYGLDTIGVGSVIGFAMECYERGVITKKDTGGIDLTWGNAEAILTMVEKIARRQGFGAVLADGSKFAAERIGKGSEKWAMHMGGQDMPAHDPRAVHTVSYAWGYLTDPTPGRHTLNEQMKSAHQGLAAGSPDPELQFPPWDELDYQTSAPIYAAFSDFHLLLSAAGFCYFMSWPGFRLADFISAVTGWDFTMAQGLKVGRRIKTLRQAFNVREGIDTSQWHLPERIAAPQPTGPNAGRKIDFKTIKEKGYEALGWDAKTGKPLASTLKELGLKELVGQL